MTSKLENFENQDVLNIAENAVFLKHNGYNCSQAVLEALKADSSVSSDELKKIGSGFCLGMGDMKGVCGALIAACIIAGMKTEGQQTLKFTKSICDEFRQLSGAIICEKLKGVASAKPLIPCDQCVKNAVLSYFKVLYAE